MLSTDTYNTLVILVRHMERDGSRHFLFDKVKPIFGGLVLAAYNVNVEVVFVEAIKDDLDVA
jgi:hypothetical protein